MVRESSDEGCQLRISDSQLQYYNACKGAIELRRLACDLKDDRLTLLLMRSYVGSLSAHLMGYDSAGFIHGLIAFAM
jgi:hypothetical protein